MDETRDTIIPGMMYEHMSDSGKVELYRVLKYDDQKKYKVVNSKTNEVTTIAEEYIMNNMVQIMPDAFINFMIAMDKEKHKDVCVCVNKANDMMSHRSFPALVLRQNVFSDGKNTYMGEMYAGNQIWLGDCALIYDEKSAAEHLKGTDDIQEKASVAFYINDNQETILSFVRSGFKHKVKDALAEVKSYFTDPTFVGFSSTLKDLMIDNAFMDYLHASFNIMNIDFPIDLGSQSHDSNGDLILNQKQINKLQDVLRRYITNVTVLEYDKDIDISQIVSSMNHVMVSDTKNKIYLIVFDIVGYYVDEENEDVYAAMANVKK